MSIKVSSIDFKKSPLNFTATKNATVINNETTRKSVQLETDNSVFSAKSETLVLEPVFYASSTIYFDENGLIQNSSGEYYTTSQGYGIAGYTNSAGVLTFSTMVVLAINTPVLTAGVEGNITGTSNSSAVNVYYRLSTEEDWTEFQTGVSVTAGAWTATGTIADAGTYDFKVEDTLNPSAYAQVDDVEVTSGAVLTALQITNASDAVSPQDIYIAQTKIIDDNIIISGYTISDKIKIGSTDYSTGYSATRRLFVASITKTHSVNWIRFFDCEHAIYGIPSGYFVENGSFLSVIETKLSSGKIVSTVHNLLLADGTTDVSLALTTENANAWGVVIGVYNSKLWVVGNVTNPGWETRLWEINLDLSGQTKTTPTNTVAGYLLSGAFNGTEYGYIQQVNGTHRIDLSTQTIGSLSGDIKGNHVPSDYSPTRYCQSGRSSTGRTMISIMSLDLSSVKANHEFDLSTQTAWFGSLIFDGTDFIHFRCNASKFFLDKVADSDTYSETNIIEITPNNIIGSIGSYRGSLAEDASHYVVAGYIKGTMESGFVQGNTTKNDGFIKLVEK